MKAAGSYSRNPATGELTLLHRTEEVAPADAPDATSADEILDLARAGATPIAAETEIVEAPIPASRKTRRG